MANLIITQVEKGKGARPTLWTASKDGSIVGLIERYMKPGHPWKAILGHGADYRYLGTNFASKADAIQAIANATA